MTRYLLLLEDDQASKKAGTTGPTQTLDTGDLAQTADPGSFHASKKLALELLFPKIEELQELRDSWTKRAADGGEQMSPERLQSLFSSCITGAILVPLLTDMNSRQSRDIEPALFKLVGETLATVLDAPDNEILFNSILRTIRIYIPTITTPS